MSSQEDHREKNILLAKNLNIVKMDLRSKKKDLITLQSQLRMEKQRNSKLESEQMSIKNRIDYLKRQLDETFLKNTFGYIQLSQQLEQMHEDNIESGYESSIIGESNAISTANNFGARESTFLSKIKRLSESFASNSSDIQDISNRSFNDSSSQSTNRRHSLSFNSFQIGLNSTFVKDANENSELNRTFVADGQPNISENENPTENVTMRVKKTRNKINRSQSSSRKENQPLDTRSTSSPGSKTFVLRRGCRSIKKIDYNESFYRRKK